MKFKPIFYIFLFVFGNIPTIFSQDTLFISWSPDPGYLNSRIINDTEQHDVYILEANKVYHQTTQLVIDRNVSIIGQDPVEGAHPATIQAMSVNGDMKFTGGPQVNFEVPGEGSVF